MITKIDIKDLPENVSKVYIFNHNFKKYSFENMDTKNLYDNNKLCNKRRKAFIKSRWDMDKITTESLIGTVIYSPQKNSSNYDIQIFPRYDGKRFKECDLNMLKTQIKNMREYCDSNNIDIVFSLSTGDWIQLTGSYLYDILFHEFSNSNNTCYVVDKY